MSVRFNSNDLKQSEMDVLPAVCASYFVELPEKLAS